MFRSIPRLLVAPKTSGPISTIRSVPFVDTGTSLAAEAKTPQLSNSDGTELKTFRQRLANLKNSPDHYKMLFVFQGLFMLGALYVRFNMQLQSILNEEMKESEVTARSLDEERIQTSKP